MAKHLVMASRLIEDDPELAHHHAMSAARRAGRIAVVRESLAITAYETGDYALALRELRTFRRISGSDEQLPLMVDSERGVGRPEKALELGRSVDRSTLTPATQVSLAIAMSGARLDLGSPELALGELEIPQLDPDRAFSYSAALYDAYAEVLSELGRDDEAAVWRRRATVAAELFGDGPDEDETIEIIEEELELSDESVDDDSVEAAREDVVENGDLETPPDGDVSTAEVSVEDVDGADVVEDAVSPSTVSAADVGDSDGDDDVAEPDVAEPDLADEDAAGSAIYEEGLSSSGGSGSDGSGSDGSEVDGSVPDASDENRADPGVLDSTREDDTEGDADGAVRPLED